MTVTITSLVKRDETTSSCRGFYEKRSEGYFCPFDLFFSREGGIACAPPGEVNFAIVLWADGGNVGDIIAAIRSVPLEID